MPDAAPTTQTMTITDARERLSEVVSAVFRRQTRVVLEKDGLPVAALVSAGDLERLRRYDAEREADFAVLDRIGVALADVPDEELKREAARAVAEARADLRAEREQAARHV